MAFGKKMLGFAYRTIFFIGWILSPFTAWNDAFVNIPIAYALASLFLGPINIKFLTLVLIFYWLSNVFGIALMYAAGKRMLMGKRSLSGEIRKLILTMAAYSVVLIILDKMGLLKPIQSFFMAR